MVTLRSFRLRIALWSVCLSGLVLAAFSAWAWYMVQRSHMGRVDDSLREIAQRHQLLPPDAAHWVMLDRSLQYVFGADAGRVVLIAVDPEDRLLHRSPEWPDTLRAVETIPDHAFADPLPETVLPAQFDAWLPSPPPPPPQGVRPGADGPRGPRDQFDRQPDMLVPPQVQFRGPGDRPGPPPDQFGDPPDRQGRPPDRRGQGPPPGRGPGQGRGRGALLGLPGDVAPVNQIAALTLPSEGELWRVAVFRDPKATFAIAVELTGHQARLAAARIGFFAAFPLALSLIALGSWYLATRAIRPVNQLRDAIAEVTSHGLDKRVPDDAESIEFRELGAQFNRMMERLERSFTQAARFSADAAHELKTPLAVLQGEIEQALQTATPEAQVVLGRLLDEVQRLKSITQKLLLLSRADAGQLSIHAERVDLSAMVRDLADDVEVVAQGLKVSRQVADGIVVPGDRDLLRQILQNLADNAVKYNRDGGNIGFKLDEKHGRARLQVANTGDIPAERKDKIFDRFVRVDDARSRRVDGAGLGLSLAREIARAHGGELSLQKCDKGIVTFVLELKTKT